MGCDGGTIPRRDELVRTKQKDEQKDKDSERKFKWRHCAISQSRLEKPVVACELGGLYSKSSVLEALLNKDTKSVNISHIRALKDVKTLNLTENTSNSSLLASKGDTSVDEDISDFICPVVGLEMNGKYKFVFLWTCGCVFSKRAIDMVKTETCQRCGASFTSEDVIILNPIEEELDEMKARMETRRALAKAAKKSKRPKHGEEATNGVSEPKKKKTDGEKPATSGKTTTNGQSINLPNNGKLLDPAFAKASTSYSIAKDNEKTEVYKSLFTSHESAKKKPKAHWVTYNPLFN